ncbi:glycosyltransferase [bacterium]|nr:glycosyltransferase [bacterium]MBU1636323.1 glycosyltransferase [bacterium]
MNLHEMLIWSAGLLIVLPSVIWLLGIARWRRLSPGNLSTDNLPLISVIIAGRDEEGFIGECLASVLKSDYPIDRFEIIFVDDHSLDQTLEAARTATAGAAQRVSVLSAPDEPAAMGSKKRALTFGIEHASGEILAFTDADNRVSPGWLRAISAQFCSGTGAVIGAAIPCRSKGLGALFYRLERIIVALTSASPIGWGTPGSACGQNLALRREAFEQIGGYAHSQIPSGDDDLTVQAIARAGWKVRFSDTPDSVVSDARQPSLRTHRDATTRHQSVIRFYPLRWRLLYFFSILSSFLLLVWIGIGVFSGELAPLFWYILGTKILLDSLTLSVFTQPLGIKINVKEFAAAHILLPFYQIVRPLFSLRSGYRWKSRRVTKAAGVLSQHTT